MKTKIRLETPDDYYAVEELTREAFWKTLWGIDGQVICDEHLLVPRLRGCPSFVPELDFVAELEGRIVGHIIYSKSRVEGDNGETYETLTFGPLSILPAYQGKGIGKEMMRHSFAEAKRLGYRAVLIFGHPDYYPRVGFRRASAFGISASDGTNRDAFMAYPLYEGALDGVHGRYFIDPVHETLTQKDALDFDKRFPAKERHIPAPIDLVLARLEARARASIQALACHTLALLSTNSERELRALEGVDDDAISTIRDVLREFGYLWGA